MAVKDSITKNKVLGWYSQTDFRGGINFEKEEAAPNQLADARNVWAPDGALEQRPGRRFVSMALGRQVAAGVSTAPTVAVDAIKYVLASTAFTNYLGSAVTFAGAVGDILYIGETANPVVAASDATVRGFAWASSNYNTANTILKGQYWNGTSWAALSFTHAVGNTGIVTTPQRQYAGAIFGGTVAGLTTPNGFSINYEFPKDIASSAVNAVTRFWVRFVITSAATSSTIINNVILYKQALIPGGILSNSQASKISGVTFVRWPGGGSTLITNLLAYDGTVSGLRDSTGARRADIVPGIGYGSSITAPLNRAVGETSTWATSGATTIPGDYSTVYIPEYGEVLTTQAGVSFLLSNLNTVYGESGSSSDLGYIGGTDYNKIRATPETRAEFVGATSAHPIDVISQASVWPSNSYHIWHDSILFGARSGENPYEVRWSAPSAATEIGYKIWPNASRVTLLGGDYTPITGMASWSEHVLVFKKESLWRLVYTGLSPEALNKYEGVRLDGGVGCISHNSIKPTPAGLVYASSSGLYIFDGRVSTKISRRLNKFWKTLNLNTAPTWRAYHWKAKQCYLLAVASKDSLDNNLVIVWDYEKNAFWIWDNFKVAAWVDGDTDSPELYYADKWGTFWQVKGSDDSGAAIDAWAVTHRFGFKEEQSKRFRAVSVVGTNKMKTAAVSLIVNDRDSYSTGTMDFNDPSEPLPENFKFNADRPTAKKNRQRLVYFRDYGTFAQVKIRNTTKNTKLEVTKILVGLQVQ